MQYKCLEVESKSPDWKVITIQELGGGREISNVSVNRFKKDSKEDVWDGEFDRIEPDKVIEGDYWKSPSGKHFLFPPKKEGAKPGFTRQPSGAVKAAQITSESVEKSQENRGIGIKIAAAFRDAALILTSMDSFKEMSVDEIQGQHKYWRKWLIAEWNQEEKEQDLPFV